MSTRLVIKTIYEPVDDDFMDFWFKQCAKTYGIKDRKLPHKYQSRDPENPFITATTTIEIRTSTEV